MRPTWYKVTDPYFALICAPSITEAVRLYREEVIGDEGDRNEMSLDLAGTSEVIDLMLNALTEDLERLGKREALADIKNMIDQVTKGEGRGVVVLVDGTLI